MNKKKIFKVERFSKRDREKGRIRRRRKQKSSLIFRLTRRRFLSYAKANNYIERPNTKMMYRNNNSGYRCHLLISSIFSLIFSL